VNGLSRLTRRELEVLGHLVAGRSYTEIAGSLFISDKTVSVHVSNLLRKTGTKSRVEAAEFARRHGLGAAQ
jgi:DNA-binding NarL/FixJ family response regulator